MSDAAKQAAEKAKGKKAKAKPMDGKVEGTKAVKLGKDVRQVLEEAFPKAKLDKVRLHVGGNAAEMCKSVGAKAFTVGNDVFFGKGSDAKDDKLVAHELAHVIQQGGGKMPKEQKGKVLTSK